MCDEKIQGEREEGGSVRCGEWDLEQIKRVASIVSGHGFPISMQGKVKGDVAVFKAGDISVAGQEISESGNNLWCEEAITYGFCIIPPGSTIFPKIGEAMKKNSRSMTMVNCCVDNNCQAFVPRNINSEYLYYISECIDMNYYDNGAHA